VTETAAKAFFITGTDTDIGKTYISSVLLNEFSKSCSVTYMKPVQTGCSFDENGSLIIPDFDFVKDHAHVKIAGTTADYVPYCFEPACSPHLAASMANREILFDTIMISFRKISSQVDYTLVEGAGGILAPISQTKFMVDLIRFLEIPAIVVTSGRLGTINHTLLTVNALQGTGVPVAGVIMNNCTNEPDNYIYRENSRIIRTTIHPIPFLEVSYGATDHESIRSFCRQIRSL